MSSIVAPNGAPAPQAYSPARVAALLDCSRDLVDSMIAEGTLSARKHRGRVFVTADSIHEFPQGGQS